MRPIVVARVAVRVLAAALAFVPGVARAAEAAEAPFSLSAEVDLNSRYVWRGIALSQGAVINPSLTLAHGGWSLNAWANLDREPSLPRALNELDGTLAWSGSFLGIEVSPSLAYYTYPQTGVPSTAEAQIEARFAVRGPVSAFTRQSVELMEVKGAAWSAAGLACELPEWRHVALAGNVQYGRGWWRFASAYADESLEGLNVLGAGVSAEIQPPGAAFTLRPHLDWYGVGNAPVRHTLTGPSPWVFGLAVGGEF